MQLDTLRCVDGEGGGLRDRTRRAVRAELAGIAMRMFEERGYEKTTVDDIARAAGLTKRSFFRYFPAKEDAAFAEIDMLGESVVAEIRSRPADEPPWSCLHQVLRRWDQQSRASERELAGYRIIEATPALRAKLRERREVWRQNVSRALRERPGATIDRFTADLLTSAGLAVLESVAAEWQRTDGTADRGVLLDRAFTLLRSTPDIRVRLPLTGSRGPR
jgi:AcrR family transcriptional regulator